MKGSTETRHNEMCASTGYIILNHRTQFKMSFKIFVNLFILHVTVLLLFYSMAEHFAYYDCMKLSLLFFSLFKILYRSQLLTNI